MLILICHLILLTSCPYNEIFNYHLFKKAMNSGTEKCICKIIREVEINNQLKIILGPNSLNPFKSVSSESIILSIS